MASIYSELVSPKNLITVTVKDIKKIDPKSLLQFVKDTEKSPKKPIPVEVPDDVDEAIEQKFGRQMFRHVINFILKNQIGGM